MKAGEILQAAASAVEGPRNDTHGTKKLNMAHTAALWTAYKGVEFSAADVAHMMVLLKMSRVICGKPLDDHWVDMAGYAAIAGEVSG